MKTVEFGGTLESNGQIAIPAELVKEVPAGERVHLAVAWSTEDDEDRAWRAKGRVRFEAACAPEDSVYEKLMDVPATR